jgi:uroporphyrinogen III methyltransferase / synthase
LTLQASGARRVVITRSREGNEELALRLGQMGFQAISIDTMSFSPPYDWSGVDGSLRRLHDFDWLVFTSATGAEFFARRASELSIELPWRGKPAVAAVGEKTRDALRGAGVSVGFVPSEYLAEKLAVELPTNRGRDVLLLRADIANPAMTKVLTRRGFRVEEHAIYLTRLSKEGAEADIGGAEAIIFASPSAVEGFSSRVDAKTLARARGILALCIGPVTAQAAKGRGFKRTAMPKVHTFEGVLEELRRAM